MTRYKVALQDINKRAHGAVLIAAIVALLTSSARGQSAVAADEDPVARSMKTVEASIDERARAADLVLTASKFVNESAAARKQGDRARAKDALKEAEKIASQADEFNRSALIDELARVLASEQASLSAGHRQSLRHLPPDKTIPIAIPRTMLARMNTYRDTFARILEEEGVPVGLLGVALVESGFNPLARSPKGARGIWQFMPATAERYGLQVSSGLDHRTHPEHSTRAAARYLRDLYGMFGDWKLALAGYNAGEGRVQSIINRTGIRDYEEMSRRGLLPLETRKYVPAVLAAWSRVVGHPLPPGAPNAGGKDRQSNPSSMKAHGGN